MEISKKIRFDCPNPDCSISVFTLRPDQISIKWVRSPGAEDYLVLQAKCPVCNEYAFREEACDNFKEIFNSMLEDIFRDIDPNLPEGV